MSEAAEKAASEAGQEAMSEAAEKAAPEAMPEATSEAAEKAAPEAAASEAAEKAAAPEVAAPEAAAPEAAPAEAAAPAGKKCTRCGVETTSVWRKDRVTQERICNKCYREVWVLPYKEAIAKARAVRETAAKVEKPREEKKAEKPPEEKKAPEVAAKKASAAAGSNGEESRKRSRELTRELSRTASDGPDPLPSEQKPPAALDLATPDVETDTEYADADLSEAPIKVLVLHSGSDKTDGTYWLMAKGSRGKPCFAKWAEKRTTFLYWNKKWILGWVFGSVKSNAHLKDVPGLSVPCEPYPRTWKVLEKRDKHADGAADDDKRHYLDNLAMRVVDGSVEDMALEDERVGRQVPYEGHKLREKRTIESKRKRKVVADGETVARRSQDAAGPEDSSEDSDSDSSESSSSSAPAPKAKAAKAAKPEPAKPEPAKEAAPKSAPQDFEQKLRSELLKVTTHAARQQKWESVKDILLKRAAGETGGPERMKALFGKIQAWLTELAEEDAAKNPKKSTVAKTKTAGGGKRKPTGGKHEPDKNLPRAPAILRKSGGPRRTKPLTFSDAVKGATLVKEELVASYRTLGESLWHTSPGAMVICDSCEKEVLQSMGTLQGAGNRSQFAQNTFLCTSCQGA